ncbi:MAG: hypothetical protein ICV60_22535 [Pyrinomonadaceae bacterium]|nr:hypothetical protein [Pyrinomonadaceae bacterium]
MVIALLLALVAVAGGAVATYLYDGDAPLYARLSMGACTGFAALGFAAFLLASVMGLTTLALLLAAAVVALPLLLLKDARKRERVVADWERAKRSVIHPSKGDTQSFVFYAVVAVLLWLLFDRVMVETAGGWATGVTNNYGDLPFHLGVITSFVYGNNFPPQDPEFAGVKFTYPFIADLVAACFVRAGASLREALFLENYILSLSLVGLLHRWARVLTRSRAAARLTPVLVLLSGGLGWWMLFSEAREGGQGIFSMLGNLPHDYTIMPRGGWRWGNSLTSLLIPQRSILLGLPLALVVFTEWWSALRGDEESEESHKEVRKKAKGKRTKEREKNLETAALSNSFYLLPSSRRMIAAGLIAGSLVLVHAHSFGVCLLAAACLAAIFRERWREWALFFAAAFIVSVPQMLWSTMGSSTSFRSFLGWQFGWDKGEENFLWFWFKNTGFFIPLIVAALLWRRGQDFLIPRRVLFFYLPFTIFFIMPNLIRLAPWVWDNNKVIFYWYVASAPLISLLLVELWRTSAAWRVAAALLLVSLTLAGALDVWRVISQTTEHGEFDRDGIQFAEMIKQQTPPRALLLNAPTFNHPVLLTGRRSLLGYPGHIWTHGLEFVPRETDIKRIYAGAPDAVDLLARHGVEYAVVGPLERNMMPVNQTFFERYTKVGEVGGYSLYKITRP